MSAGPTLPGGFSSASSASYAPGSDVRLLAYYTRQLLPCNQPQAGTDAAPASCSLFACSPGRLMTGRVPPSPRGEHILVCVSADWAVQDVSSPPLL